MKKIVTFKALETTRVRNVEGKKIEEREEENFKTTGEYAKTYRTYTRVLEEVNVEAVLTAKKNKVKPKNSDAFPVTISTPFTYSSRVS